MRKFLNLVFALVLVGAAGYAAWWLLSNAVTWFLGLKPETMTPVAAVVGVLLVPIITYFTTRELERRRTLESAIRGEKNKFYDELIRDLLKMLDLGKSGKPDEAFITKVFADATPRLITYGSRGVIRAWNAFRKESANTTGTSLDTLFAFEDLLKAMRGDLGHRVWTQTSGELLSIFITDSESLKKRPKKPTPKK